MKGKPIIVSTALTVRCICGETVQMQPVGPEDVRLGWALRAECGGCERHYATPVKEFESR